MACIALLSFFSFCVLILLAHARLNLDPSDHEALLTIRNELGIRGQRHALGSPCNSAGVFCERIISNNLYVFRVRRVVIESKQLRGFLSPAIGQLSELEELSLQNNQLIDQIPAQISGCRKLEILNLKNNQFSGNLPSELSSLTHLRVLDLSSNKFTGTLNLLKNFPNLEKLCLANNMFAGKVPTSLQSFQNLCFDDISGNGFLEGQVPVISGVKYSSSEFTKEKTVPKRYILAENPTVRTQTCALEPFSIEAAQAPSPTALPRQHKKNKEKPSLWILAFLFGTLTGGVLGMVLRLLIKLALDKIKGGGKDSSRTIFSPLIKKADHLAFLEKEDGVASLEN